MSDCASERLRSQVWGDVDVDVDLLVLGAQKLPLPYCEMTPKAVVKRKRHVDDLGLRSPVMQKACLDFGCKSATCIVARLGCTIVSARVFSGS